MSRKIKIYGADETQNLSKIGERLRVIRELRGLTLQEVASVLNCTKQRISCFEAGNVPSVGSLMALCKVYKTTPNTLLGGNEKLENYLSEFEQLKEKFKDIDI